MHGVIWIDLKEVKAEGVHNKMLESAYRKLKQSEGLFFFIDPTPKLSCLALGNPSDQQHCTIAHISIAPPLFFCIMAGTMGSMGDV